jgi:hypothetical protein
MKEVEGTPHHRKAVSSQKQICPPKSDPIKTAGWFFLFKHFHLVKMCSNFWPFGTIVHSDMRILGLNLSVEMRQLKVRFSDVQLFVKLLKYRSLNHNQ